MASRLQRIINNGIKISPPDENKEFSIIIFKENNKCNVYCLSKTFYLIKSINDVHVNDMEDGMYGIEVWGNSLLGAEFYPLGFFPSDMTFKIDKENFYVCKMKNVITNLIYDIPNLNQYTKLENSEKNKIISLCYSLSVNKKKINDLYLMIEDLKLIDIIDISKNVYYFNKIRIQNNLINMNDLSMVLAALIDFNKDDWNQIDMYWNKENFVVHKLSTDVYGVFDL